MSDLARRPRRTPRRVREQRAYQLAVVGGAASLATVVGFVLAIATGFSFGWPFITAIIAAVCVVLFKRTTS